MVQKVMIEIDTAEWEIRVSRQTRRGTTIKVWLFNGYWYTQEFWYNEITNMYTCYEKGIKSRSFVKAMEIAEELAQGEWVD